MIYQSPSGFIIELTFFQELPRACSFNTSGRSGLGVSISMKVVMMDVLWVVLTLPGVLLNIESTVWDVVPSSFRLVGKEHMSAILMFEPSPHLLGKHPNVLVIWTLMKPMVQWTFKIVGISVDITGELSMKTWDHIVELEGVR